MHARQTNQHYQILENSNTNNVHHQEEKTAKLENLKHAGILFH